MSAQLTDLFGDFRPSSPRTDEDWFQLDCQISEVFSPHAPIDDQTLFAGRNDILRRVVDTVFQKGRHAIIYGERGVGKTSLANIIKDQVFHKARSIRVIKRSCTQAHDFRLLWVHALDDFTIDGKSSEQFLSEKPNPYDIYKTIEMLPVHERPIFIFDEFDRLTDRSAIPLMADTIKYLADYSSKATVIIVGVAESVAELFGGHKSIQRNVQQVKMPRMSEDELKTIFDKRLPLLGMDMQDKVVKLIVELSQGLPTYTHLLGQYAALCAARRKSVVIHTVDFDKAVDICIDEADETVKETYLKAIRSTKPNNKYKDVLLACALARANEKGYFSAASVRDSYSKFAGRKIEIPYFARHLKSFCEAERGPALVKEGNPKAYEYRFSDPLVRPYAIICGMSDGTV